MKNLIALAILSVLLVSASAAVVSGCWPSPIPPPGKGPAITVTVKASDKLDPYLRDWDLFIDKAPGNYMGNDVWSGGAPSYVGYARSGATMSFKVYLTPGTHTIYLIIGQSGGSAYGVYNGIMTIGSNSYTFNGVTVSVPFAVDVLVP